MPKTSGLTESREVFVGHRCHGFCSSFEVPDCSRDIKTIGMFSRSGLGSHSSYILSSGERDPQILAGGQWARDGCLSQRHLVKEPPSCQIDGAPHCIRLFLEGCRQHTSWACHADMYMRDMLVSTLKGDQERRLVQISEGEDLCCYF